jgi:hypothetical protein
MFVYVLCLESFYTIIGHSSAHIIRSAFYLYNFLLCASIYGYVRRNGASAIVPGLIVATVLVVSLLLVFGVDLRAIGPNGRDTATFNNPNQLGYFSVCVLSFTYLLHRTQYIHYGLALVLYAAALFLAVASLSKSAMITCFIVIWFATKPEKTGIYKTAWLGLTIITSIWLVYKFFNGAFQEYVFAGRLLGMFQENDTSFVERGYTAFLQGNALQYIFGLGTDNVYSIVGHEVHSTFGTVLNTYGVFGFLLFSGMMIIWARNLFRKFGMTGLFCIASPPLLYGVMHNGTRFTIFWLLFSVSFGLAHVYCVPHRQDCSPVNLR